LTKTFHKVQSKWNKFFYRAWFVASIIMVLLKSKIWRINTFWRFYSSLEGTQYVNEIEVTNSNTYNVQSYSLGYVHPVKGKSNFCPKRARGGGDLKKSMTDRYKLPTTM
jgi:hypothetical protein